jgi:hypothetical protein
MVASARDGAGRAGTCAVSWRGDHPGYERADAGDSHQEQAWHAVKRARDSLDGTAGEHIGAAQPGDLQPLRFRVRSHIADLKAAVVRTLRRGVDMPETGLDGAVTCAAPRCRRYPVAR